MRYKIKYYGSIRMLEHTHADGCKILAPNVAALVSTIKSYNEKYKG